MRLKILALVACAVGILFPPPAQADILTLYPSQTVTVPACSPGGGTSVTLQPGFYELHVDGETANVCYAPSCASGGMQRRQGNHGPTYIFQVTQVSCRSAAGSAVVQFVPGGFIR